MGFQRWEGEKKLFVSLVGCFFSRRYFAHNIGSEAGKTAAQSAKGEKLVPAVPGVRASS